MTRLPPWVREGLLPLLARLALSAEFVVAAQGKALGWLAGRLRSGAGGAAWGLIGPVHVTLGVPHCALELPAGAIVIVCARLAWLLTMNTIGPAPTVLGDTDTR